jgi:hypothetical protein
MIQLAEEMVYREEIAGRRLGGLQPEAERCSRGCHGRSSGQPGCMEATRLT